MQVSIEKSHYNELSRNNELKGAYGAPSLLVTYYEISLYTVDVG